MQTQPKSLEGVPALKPLKLQSTKVMKSFTSLPINKSHSFQCISHMCSNLQRRWVLQQQTLCFWFHIFSFPICVIGQDFYSISLPHLESFSMYLSILFSEEFATFYCLFYRRSSFFDSFAKPTWLLWKDHWMYHMPGSLPSSLGPSLPSFLLGKIYFFSKKCYINNYFASHKH